MELHFKNCWHPKTEFWLLIWRRENWISRTSCICKSVPLHAWIWFFQYSEAIIPFFVPILPSPSLVVSKTTPIQFRATPLFLLRLEQGTVTDVTKAVNFIFFSAALSILWQLALKLKSSCFFLHAKDIRHSNFTISTSRAGVVPFAFSASGNGVECIVRITDKEIRWNPSLPDPLKPSKTTKSEVNLHFTDVSSFHTARTTVQF